MVRVPGGWKNIEDLEESISLPELESILDAAREIEHNGFKFAASLKGIDLDKESNRESPEQAFARIERRAKARLAGMSEDELEFQEIGIEFIEEE